MNIIINKNTAANNAVDKNAPTEDFGLMTIKVIMGVGMLVMIIAAIIVKPNGFLPVLGLSSAIALAASLVGGFLGFLFGIPRSSNGLDSKKTPFGYNTNLEQVSDWLTKIIVGVSLTQIPAITTKLHNLNHAVATGFANYIAYNYAYPYSGAVMVFYGVSGFLFVYLWCVLYLKEQLDEKMTLREAVAQAVSQVTDEVKTQTSNTLELDKVLSQIRHFNEQRSKIVIEESSELYKGIIEKAIPNAVTVLNDCQKNRWVSEPINDWYDIDVSFANNELDKDNSYLVTIEVKQKEGVEQNKFNEVYFFLHDSYCPGCIKKVFTNTGDPAALSITSYEAFTIGIYIPETNTKLELDLNTHPKTPEEYKYKETLPTIKELEEKKKALEGKEV
jgi:hypothetical protein